jgi:hypothetical protein
MLSAAVMFSDIMLSAAVIVLGNIVNRDEAQITVRTEAIRKVRFDRFVVILCCYNGRFKY